MMKLGLLSETDAIAEYSRIEVMLATFLNVRCVKPHSCSRIPVYSPAVGQVVNLRADCQSDLPGFQRKVVESSQEAPMPRTLLILVIATSAAFAQNPTDKETALGNTLAANLESRVKPLADPDVTALVDRLQKTLSQGRVPARLKILDTTEPVASALPGSFLLLSSGAIVRSNTE